MERIRIIKSQKGVTLVALGVTIVLLIIITAIIVNTIIGDESIINTAERTKEDIEGAKDDVQRQLNEIYDTNRKGAEYNDYDSEYEHFRSTIAQAIASELEEEVSPSETAEQMAAKIGRIKGQGESSGGASGSYEDGYEEGYEIAMSEAELGYYENLNNSTNSGSESYTFTVPSGWKKYRIEITTRSGYNATVNMTSSQYGNKTLTRTSNTQISGNSDGGTSDHSIVINSDKSGTITVKGNQRLWYLSMKVCMVK